MEDSDRTNFPSLPLSDFALMIIRSLITYCRTTKDPLVCTSPYPLDSALIGFPTTSISSDRAYFQSFSASFEFSNPLNGSYYFFVLYPFGDIDHYTYLYRSLLWNEYLGQIPSLWGMTPKTEDPYAPKQRNDCCSGGSLLHQSPS